MYIVTAEEMYDMDQKTINDIGMDSRMLMENAGRSMADRIKAGISKTDSIWVAAGSGNNGGDGFVIARTLLDSGFDVSVLQVVPNEKVSGDALSHKHLLMRCGGHIRVTSDEAIIQKILEEADVIIDAMLGIGVKGELREPFDKIVPQINQSSSYVISVDIPSGLPADEDSAHFQAVQANETIIAGYPKVSTFLEATAPYYGSWTTVSIGIPSIVTAYHEHRRVWTSDDFQKQMPKRHWRAHKGEHGHGLVIGGSADMPGSVTMTTKAALRSGSGLITTASTRDVKSTVASHCMEATYITLPEKDGYLTDASGISFDHYDAVALGMGMGRQPDTGDFVKRAVEEAACPLLIDADGLYHLKPLLSELKDRTHPVIVTPHPGEMAMLLDISVQELLQSPFSYTAEFADAYQVYVILKGAFTIITSPDGYQIVSTSGNQGLAKGGTGDVLSGITLAMLMQQQSIMAALGNACFLHGEAADILTAENHSVYDLLASDLIEAIPDVYRTFSGK